MNNLNIFVSSTCYDLSQIRIDLSEFIENCGHKPILSEFENFPISPKLNTIENCIKIVKENADILILVVGNRYGSIIENGKSITNNEFLVAKQKGIPIFCFIDKNTLNSINFWKNNKNGDFSNIVDNTKIFEFIVEIRENSKIWTFPFEKAQDIIRTLKVQLSYLFKSSLEIKKILDDNIPEFLKLNLSEKSLKILIEEKDLYEYLFLAQILVDEIQKKEFLRNDIEYSIITKPKHIVEGVSEVIKWNKERFSTANNIIGGFSNITNIALPKFINEPGKPSDIMGLYYFAVKYAELYENLLIWTIETKSTLIDDEFEFVKKDLSDLILKPSNQTWNFPFKIQEELIKTQEKLLLGEKCEDLNFSLTIELDKKIMARIMDNIQKLKNYF